MATSRLTPFDPSPRTARCQAGRIFGFVALVLAAFGPPATVAGQGTGEPVAIVVHPSTAVDNLTSAELRSIFLGEQQYWPDRSRITLLVRAPVAHERRVVLERIYRMDESQFRQYWIAKIFRAEIATGPKIVYSNEMALELVTAIPGAITFVPASRAAGLDMKILRIDGRLPGDAGYTLR